MKKKILLGFLGTGLLANAMCCVPVFAAEQKVWTIGAEENTNGPVAGEQGTNGWYFLYGEETNTDGKLDSAKLKECEWTSGGSCWVYYGHPEMWLPEKYAVEDYDFSEEKNWWLMDDNGIMNAGADNYRSVIAWEAPESGTYSIAVNYTAGTDSYEWEGITYYQEDADGLTLSLNTESEVLEKAFCKEVTKKEPDLTEGTFAAEVELKKGERIYVSSDPGEHEGGDSTKIEMNIEQTKAASVLDNTNVLLVIVLIAGITIGIVSVLIRKKREAL